MSSPDPLDSPALLWLHRGRARSATGTACAHPDCTQVVFRRLGAGRPRWFCRPAHAQQARRRRQALIDAIATIETSLVDPSVGSEQRSVYIGHWNYLTSVLRMYPDVGAALDPFAPSAVSSRSAAEASGKPEGPDA